MLSCTFTLNGKPLSQLRVGTRGFDAFSGTGQYVNSRQHACMKGFGPIPPGSYYVLDRESGGVLGSLRDMFTGRGDWLALYADDGVVDDQVVCDQIRRGNFRLHPKGPLGLSEGCITIERPADFDVIRSLIRSEKATPIPRSQLMSYGRVVVS
jgi:hypothetical protein